MIQILIHKQKNQYKYQIYNKPNQPFEFRTKNCDEKNDDSRGRYNTNI